MGSRKSSLIVIHKINIYGKYTGLTYRNPLTGKIVDNPSYYLATMDDKQLWITFNGVFMFNIKET